MAWLMLNLLFVLLTSVMVLGPLAWATRHDHRDRQGTVDRVVLMESTAGHATAARDRHHAPANGNQQQRIRHRSGRHVEVSRA
jgi:hypothetical protein